MVYVFKTSVSAERQAERIIQKLSTLTPNSKCNFDLEDCDKILRVEGSEVTAEQIIAFLKSCNFECLELE
ncbi:hypothetical protein SAMN06265346_104211 [Flavobacterium hercynium]|uniref:HMA domain-containing protein n=1 Tax=Flavobacterium hercynium TaxID=387094 RepID=A0A226GT46_9FLAO|nr:hypothetical protein B0A66_20800 [Flavobacterium hercynium]SMP15429.1 hypothetical protein SAMN06265346_104211 [Flavobacterium hercynium]